MADKRRATKKAEQRSKAKSTSKSSTTAKRSGTRRVASKAKRAAAKQVDSASKKVKASAKKSLKSTLQRKKSAPKAEQNRPQGAPEGKRKRQQAKRKRRFDSVMAEFKERTHIDSLQPTGTWLGKTAGKILGSGWHTSKITSALLLTLAIGTIFLIFTEPRFFVYADDVSFQNLNYLYPEELYPELEIDGWSVFWIRPDQVREAVTEHSYVADADVSIRFPAQIMIAIEEEEPAALWVTDSGQHWVLADGTALAVRTTHSSDLVQIIDGQQDAAMADAEQSYLVNTSAIEKAALDPSSREPSVVGVENLSAVTTDAVANIDKEILLSALQLADRYPGLKQISYNRGFGLNFMLPQRTEWIYWGDGNNFSQKLENMAAIHHAIARKEASASVIDLRSPEKPYYR